MLLQNVKSDKFELVWKLWIAWNSDMMRTRFFAPVATGRYTLNHRRNNSGRICWFWNSWNLAAPPIRPRRRRSLGTTSGSWRWSGPRPEWRPSWSPKHIIRWWRCQWFISSWIWIWVLWTVGVGGPLGGCQGVTNPISRPRSPASPSQPPRSGRHSRSTLRSLLP